MSLVVQPGKLDTCGGGGFELSFSVQMPGPREVILGQKSANFSLQEHYCWSKVPTTGRLVTSNPPFLCPE